jgi:hypothetical protein
MCGALELTISKAVSHDHGAFVMASSKAVSHV